MENLHKRDNQSNNNFPRKADSLTYLELRGVGPAKKLTLEPAKRLNLITGDNGLGKTFLLECVWWALRGRWAGSPAYPRDDAGTDEPKIIFQTSGESARSEKSTATYDWQNHTWQSQISPAERADPERSNSPGLLIYARVDGSFAIWDPAKNSGRALAERPRPAINQGELTFSQAQIWDGAEATVDGKTQVYLNGLLRDWITWQNKPEKYPFAIFKEILNLLSPPATGDLGLLEPGNPTRLPYDAREIPTLKHPYGEVPIVHASAGVRRIISLAYLIVWVWEEHKVQSRLARTAPQKRMVILVDEIEAHLHPQWQRAILPALLTVNQELEAALQIQFFVATHSPLVAASMEPYFDNDRDKFFHLDLPLGQSDVVLNEIPFVRHGPIDTWLMSDVFELEQARSLEAETFIEKAKRLQEEVEPDAEAVKKISEGLIKYLAPDDEFWPRWKYFAEQHGVTFDPYPTTT